MNVLLRREEKRDFKAVFTLIKQAFKSMDLSNHKEQFLVERLRKSSAFIPELSLVAEVGDEIVGHMGTSNNYFASRLSEFFIDD